MVERSLLGIVSSPEDDPWPDEPGLSEGVWERLKEGTFSGLW